MRQCRSTKIQSRNRKGKNINRESTESKAQNLRDQKIKHYSKTFAYYSFYSFSIQYASRYMQRDNRITVK